MIKYNLNQFLEFFVWKTILTLYAPFLSNWCGTFAPWTEAQIPRIVIRCGLRWYRVIPTGHRRRRPEPGSFYWQHLCTDSFWKWFWLIFFLGGTHNTCDFLLFQIFTATTPQSQWMHLVHHKQTNTHSLNATAKLAKLLPLITDTDTRIRPYLRLFVHWTINFSCKYNFFLHKIWIISLEVEISSVNSTVVFILLISMRGRKRGVTICIHWRLLLPGMLFFTIHFRIFLCQMCNWENLGWHSSPIRLFRRILIF